MSLKTGSCFIMSFFNMSFLVILLSFIYFLFVFFHDFPCHFILRPSFIFLFVFYMVIVSLKIALFEPRHEISNNVVCATSKATDQPALRICAV